MDRPILFQGDLVRAILAGTKSVTRRPVKLPGSLTSADVDAFAFAPERGECEAGTAGDFGRLAHAAWVRCPFGGPGDRLWVRETWAGADRMYEGHDCDPPHVIAYRADLSARRGSKLSPVPAYDLRSWNWDSLTWRPSIHMPRWACRLVLDVTDVRVERLQDITEEDAKAEGIDGTMTDGLPGPARSAFAEKWNAIYGKDPALSWDANPWVWRVAFKRAESAAEAA